MRKRLLALGLIAPVFAFAAGCEDSGAKVPDNVKKADDLTKDKPPEAPPAKDSKKPQTGTSFAPN